MEGRFEEVIRRLFERRQHERAILEFRYAEARDSEHFALESHDVAQQHRMSRIDR